MISVVSVLHVPIMFLCLIKWKKKKRETHIRWGDEHTCSQSINLQSSLPLNTHSTHTNNTHSHTHPSEAGPSVLPTKLYDSLRVDIDPCMSGTGLVDIISTPGATSLPGVVRFRLSSSVFKAGVADHYVSLSSCQEKEKQRALHACLCGSHTHTPLPSAGLSWLGASGLTVFSDGDEEGEQMSVQ